MRKKQIIIFFSIFLTLYGAINYYIFIRGYQALDYVVEWRPVYTAVFLSVSMAYLVGRFLERRFLSLISDVFIWVGSFWFAFILYFFLSIILLDLIRATDHFVHFIPRANYQALKFNVLLGVVIISVVIIFIGYLNARNLRVRKFEFNIPKRNAVVHELNIVVATDIHLGTIVNRKWTKNIVSKINSLDPDIVLLPGDIVDGDVEPVIKQNLGEVLRAIRSKYGIFGVTGNHEYIGGVEPAVAYIQNHGIRVLRDEIIEAAGITIMGREDRSAGKKRKLMADVAVGIDPEKALIVMDHQPFKLEESVLIGADIQLSGHTHHGQLWPLNFITQKVYELSWGYKKIGDTHIYVSCGAGLWGPPVRLGNTPEIILIKLKFTH